MTKKNILRSLILAVFSFILVMPSAFAATAIVDNDATSSQPGWNQSEGPWKWSSGSGYNNDYRSIPANTSSIGAYYLWHYNVQSVNASYYVYLANPSFNCPSAAYQIGEYGGWVNVNQNTAPTGWTYLKQYKGTHHFINLSPGQSTKSGTIGADATKLVY
ncbi:hypothetical protein [Lysinibacillus sp. Bpr_S20]|uniref:hypothetical protein n=1 Tax=Lysinibacillus sp. Bpr_S20 TaxID=2933964 RepID=UPI002012DE3B|nr:hypothetical protein [Lysinibacillus sp. Bpr_S20]MCL1701184.1 hypothetical protein [Lysinibacillus sp. Bpr_S20]